MKISAGMEHEGTGIVQNGGITPTSGNNYNFTQNNYSPKALSRIDIYRQTKNQFSALKVIGGNMIHSFAITNYLGDRMSNLT